MRIEFFCPECGQPTFGAIIPESEDRWPCCEDCMAVYYEQAAEKGMQVVAVSEIRIGPAGACLYPPRGNVPHASHAGLGEGRNDES